MLKEGSMRASRGQLLRSLSMRHTPRGGCWPPRRSLATQALSMRELLKAKDELVKAKDEQVKAKETQTQELLKAKDELVKAKDEQLKAKDELVKAKETQTQELLKAKDEQVKAKETQTQELLKAKDELLKAKDSQMRTEKGALHTELMMLKGRLHVRGLLEEAEDILKLRLAGFIQKEESKYGKLTRYKLIQLFAEKAPNDPLVLCMTQATNKKKPGLLVEQLYSKLSSNIHMAAQNAALEGTSIIIPMGMGLNADEVKLLVCLAEAMCLKHQLVPEGASAMEEPPGTEQESSLPWE